MTKIFTALVLGLSLVSTSLSAQAAPRHAYRYHVRHVPVTTLSDSQIAYALAHQQQSIARLRSMHQINISQIRIVRLTARQRARFHVAGVGMPQTMAYDPFGQLDAGYQTAQIFNSNNPLVNILQQVVTSVIVNGALQRIGGGGYGNNGGYCGTDQYGNPVPCNNGGSYCGTDQYGNPVPCNNGGGYCATDQYGNPVPCNGGGNYGYGGNSAGATLANVLLGSGIPISSLIGVLFNGNILNAIVGV